MVLLFKYLNLFVNILFCYKGLLGPCIGGLVLYIFALN